MSIGDFSPSQDSEDEAFHCTPGTIPILPVRFSLQPYDNILKPAKPTGITAPGGPRPWSHTSRHLANQPGSQTSRWSPSGHE